LTEQGYDSKMFLNMKSVVSIILFVIIFCFFKPGSFAQVNSQADGKFLIVLDVQEYYTVNKLSDYAAQTLIDSVNYVIRNTQPDHVIYVRTIHKVLNLAFSFPLIYVSNDTLAMRFDKRLNLVNAQIFSKDKPDAFSSDALTDFLKQNNVKEIVIIGLLAEQCIYDSFIGGMKSGYTMYMIPEAILGKSEKSKANVLRKLELKGVRQSHIGNHP